MSKTSIIWIPYITRKLNLQSILFQPTAGVTIVLGEFNFNTLMDGIKIFKFYAANVIISINKEF